MEEVSDSEEAPQKTGVHPDVESTRDEVKETQQAEHELLERGTEGAGAPANPFGEGVKRLWWREAGEAAEFDRLVSSIAQRMEWYLQ
ncbi:hypothetical protein EMWEY_00015620 [Eimeria maxima]|uniref:Uncharacterized protein n=1 Tax=Eimeria maxima TaxID=5804 RepID=U6M7G1_EIMMA|nr:hypothetical protein EMWEY_00015620 [Eimeria maxima]CDJ58414.1 hypothetical protein EMWEY_00015620 [Eimeria maxima]